MYTPANGYMTNDLVNAACSFRTCRIVYLVVPIYIAEISPKQRRGVLVSVNFLAMPVGFLVGAIKTPIHGRQ